MVSNALNVNKPRNKKAETVCSAILDYDNWLVPISRNGERFLNQMTKTVVTQLINFALSRRQNLTAKPSFCSADNVGNHHQWKSSSLLSEWKEISSPNSTTWRICFCLRIQLVHCIQNRLPVCMDWKVYSCKIAHWRRLILQRFPIWQNYKYRLTSSSTIAIDHHS